MVFYVHLYCTEESLKNPKTYCVDWLPQTTW